MSRGSGGHDAAAAGPLRIAFLDSWHTSPHEGSGTAVGIERLARGLRGLGHRVRRLSPAKERSSSLLHRLRFNLTADRRLRSSGPWDLVVGFDVDGVLVRHGAPFVLCLKGVAADEARFETGRDRLLLSLMARLEASNARRARRVILPSRYSAEVVRREYGIPARTLRVVPEPLDLEPWEQLHREEIPRPSRPTILSVARQYPRKDTATLLRALARIRRRLPDVRLRVIGGGPELPRLRALARSLDLTQDTVTFEGAVPDDDVVRRAFFQAHVFCLPSLQEGFGIAFAEAMAAGLPVVAARAGAVPEVVADGETGVLVPPGDAGTLARVLVRLLTSVHEARRMGRAGRARAARFGVDRVARRFVDAATSLESLPASLASSHFTGDQ